MPARPEASNAIEAGSGVAVDGSPPPTEPLLPPVPPAPPVLPVVGTRPSPLPPPPVLPPVPGLLTEPGGAGLLATRSDDPPPLTAAMNTPMPTAAPPPTIRAVVLMPPFLPSVSSEPAPLLEDLETDAPPAEAVRAE